MKYTLFPLLELHSENVCTKLVIFCKYLFRHVTKLEQWKQLKIFHGAKRALEIFSIKKEIIHKYEAMRIKDVRWPS